MPQASIKMDIQNIQSLLDKIKSMEDSGKKAISNTLKDVKSRAPGWIAGEVTKIYNIKKGEITPSSGNTSTPRRKASTMRIAGETFDSLTFTYTGRRLTPLHFSMTPKTAKPLQDKKIAIPASGLNLKGGKITKVAMARIRKPYNVYATIKKGNKEKLTGKYNTSVFLAPASKGSSKMIPFQRTTSGKHNVESIHTLSVPQMIENEAVNESIHQKLTEETGKRLQHHLDRAFGK